MPLPLTHIWVPGPAVTCVIRIVFIADFTGKEVNGVKRLISRGAIIRKGASEIWPCLPLGVAHCCFTLLIRAWCQRRNSLILPEYFAGSGLIIPWNHPLFTSIPTSNVYILPILPLKISSVHSLLNPCPNSSLHLGYYTSFLTVLSFSTCVPFQSIVHDPETTIWSRSSQP